MLGVDLENRYYKMSQGVTIRRVQMPLLGALLCIGLFLFTYHTDSSVVSDYLESYNLFSPTECNPYLSMGYLNDSANPHSNRWIPFDSQCHAPALMASFAKAAWAIKAPAAPTELGSEFVEAELGPDGYPWIDMEWVRGRTVLFAGDSVARTAMMDFCKLTGGLDQSVDPGHWLWPQTDPQYLEVKGTGGGHNGRMCYVESLDFMILQLHTFGMDEVDYYASKEKEASGPYKYEERFEFIGKGMVDIVREKGRTTAPDLVMLHSGLWDTMRFLRYDIKNGRDLLEPIPSETILEWQRRVNVVDERVKEIMPDSPRLWSSMHYPIASEQSGWFFENLKQGGGKSQRPKTYLNRVAQMNMALHYTIEAKEKVDHTTGVWNWGEIIKGTERFMLDDIHPATFPANYVWADMVRPQPPLPDFQIDSPPEIVDDSRKCHTIPTATPHPCIPPPNRTSTR